LVLAPELKEVQFEEARYYYHCELDYSKSLEILEKLKNEYPNNDEIYAWIGYVYRRMGEFGKALEKQGKAISLNPSDWSYWSNRANTLQVLREYSNVENCYKQAIELNPSNSGLYVDLLGFYVNSGQMQKAREFLNVNEKFIDSQNQKRYTAQLEFLARNYVNAIQIVQSLSEDPFSFQTEYYTKYLQLGLIYRKIPDNAMAVMNFKIERDLLLKKINETRNDQRLYRSLGIVYAGLGMKKEAIEAGRKALEMLDFSKDALGGFEPEMDMVRILIMVGEYDEAIIRLDNIMERHGDITAEILKLDPFWDPVRDHEKFKEIVSYPAYQVSLSGE
jgi:tetratricopeptide (TPR) repeat protein